jgi:hypothetical protein
MSARTVGVVVLMAVALAACGEKSQVMDGKSAKKWDEPAWAVSSAAEPTFAAQGWKSTGDKAAWEQQIRQRGQSQNDYAR